LPSFPFLGLVVSGGHTSLFIIYDFQKFELLGKTRDDALGEAYDKVAKILGLGFPGGPIIEERAKNAVEKKSLFPIARLEGSFDFSYSGLKTAVLYYVREKKQLSQQEINEICYSFQESALRSLIPPLEMAIKKFKIQSLIVGGGVAVNTRLRELLKQLNINVYLPSYQYCMDNASMVAALGYWVYNKESSMGVDFGPYSTFEERWNSLH
ncbi:MAG TPA: tRNA (adenosine(37)-N6)-threonylcarbamoyltransferase complex transferase subunit TsaD, partial [Candidatus Omnitrophica bacterium]|nr:tRNA (adenosine(37)-N6)-threonylcarbamoyltransferase complex transferase subunit TsaD [Candidatus Omnitrophota bacterium]